MTDVPIKNIRNILDYLHNERKYYEECVTSGLDPGDEFMARHIDLNVKLVDQWLKSLHDPTAIGMNDIPFAPR
jgi:hypothetical protein